MLRRNKCKYLNLWLRTVDKCRKRGDIVHPSYRTITKPGDGYHFHLCDEIEAQPKHMNVSTEIIIQDENKLGNKLVSTITQRIPDKYYHMIKKKYFITTQQQLNT